MKNRPRTELSQIIMQGRSTKSPHLSNLMSGSNPPRYGRCRPIASLSVRCTRSVTNFSDLMNRRGFLYDFQDSSAVVKTNHSSCRSSTSLMLPKVYRETHRERRNVTLRSGPVSRKSFECTIIKGSLLSEKLLLI